MVKQKMNDIPDQVSRTRDPSKNSPITTDEQELQLLSSLFFSTSTIKSNSSSFYREIDDFA